MLKSSHINFLSKFFGVPKQGLNWGLLDLKSVNLATAPYLWDLCTGWEPSAQLAERQTTNPKVPCSTPAREQQKMLTKNLMWEDFNF